MAEWWGPIAAGAGVVGAVGGFGYFMDNKLDDAFRAKVRDKLMRVPPEGDATGDDNWTSLFLVMFDRLFDPKSKGRPRFWRSALASMTVLMALIVAWGIFSPERAGEIINEVDFPTFLILILFLVIPINIVGDFFSLWESRFVIGRIAVSTGAIRKAALLLFDLIATMGIFLVVFAVPLSFMAYFGWVFSTIFDGDSDFVYLEELLNAASAVTKWVTGGGLLFSGRSLDFLAIVFYTTLFTSVWVWLFMLGGVLWPLFTWLRGVLRVDKFPVGSAMAIGGVFAGLVVTALGYVRMAVLS